MQTFKGFPRADGSVGIRNHVVVTTTVACANGAVLRIANDNPGVVTAVSGGGCAQGHGSPTYDRIVEGICLHPNVYAVVLIGLGCELCNAQMMADRIRAAGRKVFCATIQHDGGSDSVVQMGSQAAKQFLAEAELVQPTEVPISKLAIGLQFANEDAYTNLYVNPIFGKVCDWIIEAGGSAIVSQVSSFFGGEDLLKQRSANNKVQDKLTELFKNARYHLELTDGNQERIGLSAADQRLGFSTVTERAAAHITMLGRHKIDHVIDAAEQLGEKKGLIFQEGAALDVAGVSNMLASGAQLVVTSTGSVSTVGWPVAPVLKVASTSQLFANSCGDLDFDCGPVINQEAGCDEIAQKLIHRILDVANGEMVAAESHDHDGGIFDFQYRFDHVYRKNKVTVQDFC